VRQETRHPDLEQCGLAGEVLSLSRFSRNETRPPSKAERGKSAVFETAPNELTQIGNRPFVDAVCVVSRSAIRNSSVRRPGHDTNLLTLQPDVGGD